MATILTQDNFKEFVSKDELILVDFYASWCGPCRMLGPILEEIEEEGYCKLAKVDVDKEEDIAIAFGISNIPAVFAFKGGRILGKKIGFLPKNAILNWINSMK